MDAKNYTAVNISWSFYVLRLGGNYIKLLCVDEHFYKLIYYNFLISVEEIHKMWAERP